jgi:hypothetical protein
MKKIITYKKYVHLKLPLSAITVGIEALVSGKKFLYACVKQVCRL